MVLKKKKKILQKKKKRKRNHESPWARTLNLRWIPELQKLRQEMTYYHFKWLRSAATGKEHTLTFGTWPHILLLKAILMRGTYLPDVKMTIWTWFLPSLLLETRSCLPFFTRPESTALLCPIPPAFSTVHYRCRLVYPSLQALPLYETLTIKSNAVFSNELRLIAQFSVSFPHAPLTPQHSAICFLSLPTQLVEPPTILFTEM